MQVQTAGKVSTDELKMVYHKDATQLRLVGYSVTGVGKDTKLFPELLEKIVLSRVLACCATGLGRMDKAIEVLKSAAQHGGKVDMVWMSPYDITWDDGLSTHISHSGECLAIARGLQFTKEGFGIRHAAVDEDAVATFTGSQEQGGRPLKAFFPAGVGPHKVIIVDSDKKLLLMGKMFKNKVEQEKKASAAGAFEDMDTEELVSPDKVLARRLALESARAKHKRQKLEQVTECSVGSQQAKAVLGDVGLKSKVVVEVDQADSAAGGR